MDVMQAILDIERKAKESLKETDELSRQKREELDEEIKKLESRVQDEINQSLEQTQRRCMSDEKEALDKAEREMREQLESLRAMCDQNKAKWVAQMTENIIG